MTFVGYDEHSKGCRFVNTKTKRVTISRDFKFILDDADNHKLNEEESCSELPVTIFQKRSDKYKDDNNNDIIDTGVLSDDDIFYESMNENTEILSRENEFPMVQRKSTRSTKGKPAEKYGYNVTLGENLVEPKTYNEALKSDQRSEWISAMEEEFASLKNSKSWELVTPPENSNIVSCKWTYKIKRDAEGNVQRFKARLVARGFSQKFGLDYDEVFAPVVKQATLRTLLSVAGVKKMSVIHYDIKSAFLNGDCRKLYICSNLQASKKVEKIEFLNERKVFMV